ncbi:MerR family transcriptional regulator [Brachybacterium sacelli]|uniref:DNA-binding transcriptional MerR regulator n=1 Tax=Brachybacterium sacelli TaxID=173364 RepID=A0ABS4WWN1_9MICO|nr:MerR family transcriptional regulator [Brachybacterium sacelli]MBP2380615.1 DNA-binding transcriptional MerR regulator [Brachybacterium sacelli]
MRIGELARRTGVSQRALRYYEEHGLLSPDRRPSGYRVYSQEDVASVQRIRTLLAAGLSTAQILEALPCIVDDDGRLIPGCEGLVEGLAQQRDRIDGAIDELRDTRAALDSIITRGQRAAGPLRRTTGQG